MSFETGKSSLKPARIEGYENEVTMKEDKKEEKKEKE